MDSLSKILGLKLTIDIVDIGASPSGGNPPYQPLVEEEIATVTGFEPYPEALAKLNENRKEFETYLPYAIGDGGIHEFKHCQAPEMSSLLEPNAKLLSFFHHFSNFGKVLKREEIQTVKLDEIEEISNMDMLKIDIQGGELNVFENGVKKLSECQIVHTEVEFIPLYLNQPLFSEIEIFLRGQDFIFHKFAPLRSRVLQPMKVGDSVTAGLSQIFDGDAVFMRDFTQLHKMKPQQLMKMAVILHDVYESLDVVYRILLAHDKRKRTKYASRYIDAL